MGRALTPLVWAAAGDILRQIGWALHEGEPAMGAEMEHVNL